MITKETNLITQRKDKSQNSRNSKPLIRHLPSMYDQLMDQGPSYYADALQQQNSATLNGGIFVKVDYHYKKVMIDDIYLVEALSDYMNIYTKERRYTIHSTLYALLDKLPKEHFMRVHKSFIVRMDSISAIEHNVLVVEDRRIPIGKTHKQEVLSRLNILG